jgi:predicted XRE-type DNA-binding protein
MTSYFEVRNTKELCRQLGLPPSAAGKVAIRVELASAIRKELERQQVTHLQVAQKTGIGRTVITAIANGNLKSISTDRLIDVAQGLGLKFQLKVVS